MMSKEKRILSGWKKHMSKMIPFYHIMDVKQVERHFKLIGEVTKSNFLNEGHNYSIPCSHKLVEEGIIKEGMRIKATFFADEDEIENSESKIKFDATGLRIEVWDDVSDCWDMVYEKFTDDA